MAYTVDLERRVTLMTSQRTRGVIPFDPPAYRLTAPEGWRGRVARWLWRGLERLGALGEALQKYESVQYVDFVPKNLIDGIMRQYREHQRDYNKSPSMLVMGTEDFYELAGILGTEQSLGYHSFAISSPKREFYGMEIKIIPWMRGVVVVP